MTTLVKSLASERIASGKFAVAFVVGVAAAAGIIAVALVALLD
jgi:hypothetical protein